MNCAIKLRLTTYTFESLNGGGYEVGYSHPNAKERKGKESKVKESTNTNTTCMCLKKIGEEI